METNANNKLDAASARLKVSSNEITAAVEDLFDKFSAMDYEGYQELAGLVHALIGEEFSPVWAINHLLQHWLTTSANLQQSSFDPKFLDSILATVTFIYNVSRSHEALSFLEREAEKMEVSGE